jgi:hypothetical protein
MIYLSAPFNPSQLDFQRPPQGSLQDGTLGTHACNFSQAATKKEASTCNCSFRFLCTSTQEDEYGGHCDPLTQAANCNVQGLREGCVTVPTQKEK